jgi:hypothetical protein
MYQKRDDDQMAAIGLAIIKRTQKDHTMNTQNIDRTEHLAPMVGTPGLIEGFDIITKASRMAQTPELAELVIIDTAQVIANAVVDDILTIIMKAFGSSTDGPATVEQIMVINQVHRQLADAGEKALYEIVMGESVHSDAA